MLTLVIKGAPIVTFRRFEVGPLLEAVKKHQSKIDQN